MPMSADQIKKAIEAMGGPGNPVAAVLMDVYNHIDALRGGQQKLYDGMVALATEHQQIMKGEAPITVPDVPAQPQHASSGAPLAQPPRQAPSGGQGGQLVTDAGPVTDPEQMEAERIMNEVAGPRK